MSSSEWFVISDVKQFANKIRHIVYNNFGKWENDDKDPLLFFDINENEIEEMNKVLPYKESIIIIKGCLKKQRNKITKKTRYLLNDNLLAAVIDNLNQRMISNIITSLVNKGLIESAFDNEKNDFVFWIKEK